MQFVDKIRLVLKCIWRCGLGRQKIATSCLRFQVGDCLKICFGLVGKISFEKFGLNIVSSVACYISLTSVIVAVTWEELVVCCGITVRIQFFWPSRQFIQSNHYLGFRSLSCGLQGRSWELPGLQNMLSSILNH